MEKYKILQFNKHGDENGWLISLEENKNIPFKIKRVFYIFETQKGVIRGKHALKKGKQLLIPISGVCKVLVDDGKQQKIFYLDSKEKGLLINSMVWREMFDFSDDCVLLVLSDSFYDENDYICSYKEFKKFIQNFSKS